MLGVRTGSRYLGSHSFTKLATTRFSPGWSNVMVSLLLSTTYDAVAEFLM
jgi:hypothetical protein